MNAIMRGVALAGLMLLSSISGCLFDSENDSVELEAVFTFSPSSNVRAGDIVSFDGSNSLPQDGSLTYRWDFDNNGEVDATGRNAEWTFAESGEFSVKLMVSDGTTSAEQIRTIDIVEATAVEPVAEVELYSSEWDCDNEEAATGSFILVWICEDDKSLTDRDVTATTTVTLDASLSKAGSSDDYISKWTWDMDLQDDANGDGESDNDADYSGEVLEWKDVAPGEYKIALTVTSGTGLVDTKNVDVYVSYVGTWYDFEIAGNGSNGPGERVFDFQVTYDKDAKNTIRKAVGELVYPQEDDDWVYSPGNTNRNKLDLYAYDEEDEEVANTSDTAVDQRTDGDCDSSDDCIHLMLPSYQMTDTTHGDGEWSMIIRNERFNDIQITSFSIRIEYK